ncbi:hypothetical protein K2173_005378 [Erythroxylum novogranatense]|uniref:Pectinesterase inhibitor domain-containing protein n=1 Tax=Erythroxylum novogranatense TaxID=1862640 RepID=A0AAV8TD92_9ROSI|nr:hypothetical protein K2173_005378 [Erythroxylum novogranatense]
MARLLISLSFLCFVIYMFDLASCNSSPTDFIQASCKVTLYPDLCVRCLSRYAEAIKRNDQHLALTALSVSLARAKSAANFVSKLTKARGIKPREYQAVKDCIENMGDSIDGLSDSIGELGHVGGGGDLRWHISNVQTWVSAALTDDNTCLDGFDGRAMDGNVKSAIKRRVTKVAQVTSNALTFINRLASRHQRASSGEHP